MYFYITPNAQEKIDKFNLHDEIDQLSQKIEMAENLQAIRGSFEPLYPYLKRRIGKLYRLIAKPMNHESSEIICVYEIFLRKDAEYEQFVNDRRRIGPKRIEPLLDLSQLDAWLVSKKQEEVEEPVQPPPLLPEEYRPWLQPPDWNAENIRKELLVYESREWESKSHTKDFRNYWQTYHEIVFALTDGKLETKKLELWPNIELATHKGRSILFTHVSTIDAPPADVLFLIVPLVGVPEQNTILDSVESLHFLEQLKNGCLKLDDLASSASRSYPGYILWDDACWHAIECEEEANLALSAEEEKVLRSVSTKAGKETTLPIFINGRAGSGKSTMLLYLFADYCYKKFKNKLEGEPLFLTYNERLLTVAKEGVGKLLKSHHRFLADGSMPNNIDELIAPYFHAFQQFLLNCLPDDHKEQFSKESSKNKYVSFSRFRRLYNNQNVSEDDKSQVLKLPQAKKWSAELCWHVIRSYIKGRTTKGYTEADDYQEIPRKERSVDAETYQQIYNTIWLQWYLPLTSEEGYWDDQDLIRQVLMANSWIPKYSAIFCDEAQDFTRLELQLIMRLSLFSKFALGWEPIHGLPFAFAGDPFQTLNPTGFRWASIQAAFYDEVISALDPLEQLSLGMNFQELSYNYRSLPSVVCATNLIQLWRKVLLEIPELQPQVGWQSENISDDKTVRPQIFVLGQNISADELTKHTENTIFIIPVEEGEERAFVEQDIVLSKIVPLNAKGDPPKNVLSAIAAKGLEFDRVILYKFGDLCKSSISDAINESEYDERKSIEIEYFLNKLYVAASRAKNLLFVVDSPQGLNQLWNLAIDKKKVDDLINRVKHPKIWSKNVCHIPFGTVDNIIEISESDPLAVAHELKTKGMNLQNPDNLRRAKQYYDRAGEKKEADICEAWALFYEENYRSSGRLFIQSSKIDEAWRAFVEGQCWLELNEWYQAYPERRRTEPPLNEMSVFMISRPSDISSLKSFIGFLQTRLNQDKIGDRYDRNWRVVVDELVKRLATTNQGNFQKDEWAKLAELLVALRASRFSGLEDRIAEALYYSNDYSGSVKYWEKSKSPKSKQYWLAKAESDGMPKGLEYLDSIQADDLIITYWQTAGGLVKAKSRDWLKFVGPALERQGHHSEAFYVYLTLNETTKGLEYFQEAFQKWSESQRWAATEHLINYLMRKAMWKDSLEIINVNFPKFVGSDRDSQKIKLKCDLIREIAYKVVQGDVITSERAKFEEFVSKTLENDSWDGFLSPEEAGAALERIGGFVSTLRFYEKIETSTNNKELLDFARKRWIATKQRQVEHFQNQGQSGESNFQKSSNELSKRARSWGIRRDLTLPHLPELPPRKREYPGISGLPDGVKVDEQGEGNYRFQIENVEIRTDRDKQLVLVIDTENLETVRVNFEQFKVDGQVRLLSHVQEERAVTFESQQGTFRGMLDFPHEQAVLTLNIRNVELSISLA